MTFDPSRRITVEAYKVRQAQFWYSVRLYLKVALIIGVPFSLIVWALVETFDR